MNEPLRVLDLFSGIGGISLGLERTGGFRTVAFCEIEPYCRAVLRRHWPDVPIFEDVRTLTGADVPGVDAIAGGFPCQDISIAGKGAGIDGQRSGLWAEYARLVREVRPGYVLVENVSALLGRGLERVLGDLAAIGYDAEWHCIPASAVGAPHERDRVWIVAYPDSRQRVEPFDAIRAGRDAAGRRGEDVADADGEREPQSQGAVCEVGRRAGDGGREVADAHRPRREEQRRPLAVRAELAAVERCGWWRTEPDVGRVAYGVRSRVDRLVALGNSVVPQVVEAIGRAILKAHAEMKP